MNPWELLDIGEVPGGGELRLYRRGEEFSIAVRGGGELMNSRVYGSEEALAQLPAAALRARPGARVLVGGLGMGYTLGAVLRHFGEDARVTIAELVPAVLRWNREYLGVLAGHPLEDPRVEIHEGDVGRRLRDHAAVYDAILLDVDNGPEGLTRRDNDWLYGVEGLNGALRTLTPGGILAVWSAGADQSFSDRLRRVGFDVEEVRVRARGPRKGAMHHIWLATKVR